MSSSSSSIPAGDERDVGPSFEGGDFVYDTGDGDGAGEDTCWAGIDDLGVIADDIGESGGEEAGDDTPELGTVLCAPGDEAAE